jgi:DNA-binding IclR family transcriptional regulator
MVHALSRQELINAVHHNLRNLSLDTLEVVNLRVWSSDVTIQGVDQRTADCACVTQASGTDFVISA